MATTNPDAKAALQKAFQTNETYFKMMREHNLHTGDAPSIEEEMLAFIQESKDGDTLLDAGAGEGSIAIWVAETRPKLNVIGVDLSPVGIEMANKLTKEKKLANATFKVDDLEKLSLKDNSVDRVISQSVVEHVPDLSAMLSELHRVMKPGAEGIIRVSNASSGTHFSLKHYFSHYLEPIPYSPTMNLEQGNYQQHRHNFDAHELTSYTLDGLIKKAGFEVPFVTTFPRHLRNEPGSPLRRMLIRFLMAFSWLPLIKVIGPTTVIRFKKKA